jgi:hypothetical protein
MRFLASITTPAAKIFFWKEDGFSQHTGRSAQNLTEGYPCEPGTSRMMGSPKVLAPYGIVLAGKASSAPCAPHMADALTYFHDDVEVLTSLASHYGTVITSQNRKRSSFTYGMHLFILNKETQRCSFVDISDVLYDSTEYKDIPMKDTEELGTSSIRVGDKTAFVTIGKDAKSFRLECPTDPYILWVDTFGWMFPWEECVKVLERYVRAGFSGSMMQELLLPELLR